MSCKPKVPDFEPWTYIPAYRYQKQNGIKLVQVAFSLDFYSNAMKKVAIRIWNGKFLCRKFDLIFEWLYRSKNFLWFDLNLEWSFKKLLKTSSPAAGHINATKKVVIRIWDSFIDRKNSCAENFIRILDGFIDWIMPMIGLEFGFWNGLINQKVYMDNLVLPLNY